MVRRIFLVLQCSVRVCVVWMSPSQLSVESVSLNEFVFVFVFMQTVCGVDERRDYADGDVVAKGKMFTVQSQH